MTSGFLQSKNTMLWSRKKQKMLFLPTLEDDVLLDSVDNVIDALGFFGVHKEAFCCPECKAILVSNRD